MKHHTFNDNLVGFESERRCRVCARKIPGNPFDLEEFCSVHGPEATDFEAFLGRKCVRYQETLMSRLDRYGWSEKDGLQREAPAQASVNELFRRSMLSRGKCELGLVIILREMKLLERSPDIAEILEMKFYTGPHYRYVHCAWKITSVDGQCFVFDPTGIQFGINWALLAPWYTYRWDRGVKTCNSYSLREVEYHPLGWNKVFLEEEAKKTKQ